MDQHDRADPRDDLSPLSLVSNARPEAVPTLLRNVLVPASEGDAYARRDVLIAGGVIAAISDANTLTPPDAPGRVLDGSQRMLLPGFFNAHTHSIEHWVRGLIKPLPLELWVLGLIQHEPRGACGWHGADSYTQTPALAVGISAMLCGVEALLSGCTAVLDHLFIRDAGDMAAAVAAYRAVGVRAFISPMLNDDDLSQMYWNYIPICSSAGETNVRAHAAGCRCGGMRTDGMLRETPGSNDPARTAAQLRLWEECVERFHRPDEGIHVVIGPVTAFSCSPEMLRGATAIRKKYGLAGHTHLLETRAQAMMARQSLPSGSAVRHLHEAGFLELPGTTCAHSCWLTDDEAKLMAATGASVIHCPMSNLRLGSGVMPLATYQAHGVNVAIGCDGSASSDGQDMLEVLKLTTVLHAVSTPEYRSWSTARQTALTLCARNGYRSVNCGGERGGGELAVGRLADVTLWDLTALSLLPRTDPLALLILGSRTQAPGAGSALAAAWVGGTQTVADGSPTGVDLTKLRELLLALQPEYRSPELTEPSATPASAAAEVEYRAAMCLDGAIGSGAVEPRLSQYEKGRTLYDPTLPSV
ncbi:hypothetical protein KFE25_002527 [Diacronema lutheri]|uniref:Amidohydrolase-related domain-containing protein n=1 Tax=Diacronema lutheri TaxID=2081491 RepID=A0A8J5X9P9_DIALT|nr:hypothetical protein KFE25_002527 [Diacronema lutheri]